MGDAKQDAETRAFAVPQDTAGIYVYRNDYVYRNESMGAAVEVDVELNGKPVGRTAASTYLYIQVPPGKHAITAKAENADTVEIYAQPGRIHFIWQEVKLGSLQVRTKLHLVDESQGKQGVTDIKLAAAQFGR
ncbi:MAG: DUF2846 domain-containing protein [Burkholderiaceae bacterium]|nr:DUF2846 domain-containing protein [Burkholderiaceae bacterium]